MAKNQRTINSKRINFFRYIILLLLICCIGLSLYNLFFPDENIVLNIGFSKVQIILYIIKAIFIVASIWYCFMMAYVWKKVSYYNDIFYNKQMIRILRIDQVTSVILTIIFWFDLLNTLATIIFTYIPASQEIIFPIGAINIIVTTLIIQVISIIAANRLFKYSHKVFDRFLEGE